MKDEDEDISRSEAMILVAWNEMGDCSVCDKVPGMPAS